MTNEVLVPTVCEKFKLLKVCGKRWKLWMPRFLSSVGAAAADEPPDDETIQEILIPVPQIEKSVGMWVAWTSWKCWV